MKREVLIKKIKNKIDNYEKITHDKKYPLIK